jgi:hypothetical protein
MKPKLKRERRILDGSSDLQKKRPKTQEISDSGVHEGKEWERKGKADELR